MCFSCSDLVGSLEDESSRSLQEENTTLEVSLSSVPLVIACEGCTEAQMIGQNTNWNMMGDYIFLEEEERY